MKDLGHRRANLTKISSSKPKIRKESNDNNTLHDGISGMKLKTLSVKKLNQDLIQKPDTKSIELE